MDLTQHVPGCISPTRHDVPACWLTWWARQCAGGDDAAREFIMGISFGVRLAMLHPEYAQALSLSLRALKTPVTDVATNEDALIADLLETVPISILAARRERANDDTT